MFCSRYVAVLFVAVTACGGVALKDGGSDDGGVNAGGGWGNLAGAGSGNGLAVGGAAGAGSGNGWGYGVAFPGGPAGAGGSPGGGIGVGGSPGVDGAGGTSWMGLGGAAGVGGAPPINSTCSILGSWQTHSQPWNNLSTNAVITFFPDGTLSGVPGFKGRWSLVGSTFSILETSGPDMNCDQEDLWYLTFSNDCRTAPLLPVGSGCTGARRYLDWDVTLTRDVSIGGAGGSSGGFGGAGGNGGDSGVVPPPDAASGSCLGWCTCPAGDYGIELTVNGASPVVLKAGTTGGDAGGSGAFGGCYQPIAFTSYDRQFVGIGGCLATTGKAPCLWLYSNGTGRYMDEMGFVWPLTAGGFSSGPVSSCSSVHNGEFKALMADPDGGPYGAVTGRFRACPEGPLVL